MADGSEALTELVPARSRDGGDARSRWALLPPTALCARGGLRLVRSVAGADWTTFLRSSASTNERLRPERASPALWHSKSNVGGKGLLRLVTDASYSVCGYSLLQGLADTAKKNFGGGNTAWEEKTLSKYESSEIRLVEIIENLCDSSNFECNNMVEEHEEHIEKWWFKLKKKYPDLFKWFCIETIEVCCPAGTYGPDCLACRGGSERPCHGNGHCDGDGTRGGDGSCSCNKEYTGDFCLDCSNGYFSTLRNETHSVCTACHAACKTCTGSSNKDCQDCKEGWIKNEEAACVDLDECAASPCKDHQYCLNTDGSFSCKACDASCIGCTGEGSDKCKACASGYMKEDEKCTDIDECNLPEKVCVKENQDCVNTSGSYKCVCSEGFEDKDGTCVQNVKTGEEVESETTEPSPSGHDDL
ncbi:PREDICTED: cysteine-rich with EGF-like domain protein 2 [Nipponia nippon]|uniref:cysteine-rich with EGF-like domain protein 2 n=1 Tax=Nipponia nippon TaxID=128390 RepID=UPI0005113692|nr:PREDICTED: cysteine-rich with EGF-like domain protein 2 [Nipponia nippon]